MIHKPLLIAVIFFVLPTQVFAQTSILPDTDNETHNDKSIIENMLMNGTAIENERLVCWFPKDSLELNSMREISDMLLQGLQAAEQLIKAPVEWQKFGSTTKIHFFFPASSFISHASRYNASVFIPFWRIQNDKAPWLHEMLHVLFRSKNGNYFERYGDNMREMGQNRPLWLTEGLPTYLSSEISKKESFSDFDPLSSSYEPDFNILVKEHVKKEEAQKMLDIIGESRGSGLLYGQNRNLYAPIFYHGSASFVSYIAEHYGIDVLIEAIGAVYNEQQVIELKTGLTMEQLKGEWRDSLGI